MKVLLLGDSITEYLPKDKLNIDDYYNLKKNIENGCDNFTFYKCGIENYPTEWLRQYVFPRLDTTTFDTIVLQCGINDFFMPYQDEDYAKKTPIEIYKSIIDFVEEIKSVSGKKVALQSLYPVENGKITPMEAIQFINDKLSKYCKLNDIQFLDMYSLLVGENGDYAKGLSDDSLHPNSQGYDIVAKKLSQTFCKQREDIKEL